MLRLVKLINIVYGLNLIFFSFFLYNWSILGNYIMSMIMEKNMRLRKNEIKEGIF